MHAFDPEPNAVDYRALARGRDVAAERALVEAIQQGDLDAFRALHQQCAVDLLDFAFTYLRSREDAEEVVQDLFLWIWEHRHEWAAPGGVRPYLFAATRNRAINRLRQRRAQTRFTERLRQGMPAIRSGPPTPRDPLAEVTAGELDGIITAGIEALPSRCREVFLLVRERHLSYAEVAKLLGIAPKTVEIHMNHALGALRRRVAEWRGPAGA